MLVSLLVVTTLGYVAIWWHTPARSPLALLAWAGGTVAIVVATCSPLDPLSDARFAAHMAQHELLTFVAAPLFVAGMRPLTMAVLFRLRPVARWGHAITRPRFAWITSAVVLWAWHWPPAYDLALAHPGVHDFQHATLLAAYGLYWSPFAAFGHAVPALRTGAARAFYLATGGAQSALLGAVLAFGLTPLYSHYVAAAGPELALRDEQLGGLVMLLSGAVVFATAAVVTLRADQ